MTVIDIHNLGYTYDGEHKTLEGIDLKLDRPGLYCIVGPNGVGKSTLVKCINRINKPSEGKILVDGIDSAEMKQREISRVIGYVPTVSEDVFSMPVIDAIEIGLFNNGRNNKKENVEAVYRVMRLLHIRNLANSSFKELSAGQHQKVSLARGLVQDTPVLILDEPTSNLDVKYQIYVAELLRGLSISEDKIVIMISHDLNIAARYAHEIIMLCRPGRLYCRGLPKDTITVENLKKVYDIDCKVLEVDGCPHVVPGSSVMNDDDLDMVALPASRIRSFFRRR